MSRNIISSNMIKNVRPIMTHIKYVKTPLIKIGKNNNTLQAKLKAQYIADDLAFRRTQMAIRL